MEHRWYTIREMENITRKTRSTIYRWIESGKLESQRDGARVLVRPTDGTIDIPSEPVENGTDGQVGQLLSRMEHNAIQLSEFLQSSMKRIGELERENGEKQVLIDLQTDRIEELEGIIQKLAVNLPNDDKLKLLTGG